MRVGIGPFATAPSGLAVATVDTALGLTRMGVDVTLFAEPNVDLPRRAATLSDCVVRLEPRPAAMRNLRVADAMFLATKMNTSSAWPMR